MDTKPGTEHADMDEYEEIIADYDMAWADVKRFREHGGTPNPDFVAALREPPVGSE